MTAGRKAAFFASCQSCLTPMRRLCTVASIGHVMVVPFAHMDELQKLPEAAAQEMMALSQKMEGVLRQVYTPDGINLGMNVGRAAGAGVAGHIHMHILPRWVGDTSFMTVTGEVRVLPESLDETYKRIGDALRTAS